MGNIVDEVQRRSALPQGELERYIARFLTGRQFVDWTAVDANLPAGAAERRTVLVELVALDLERRWQYHRDALPPEPARDSSPGPSRSILPVRPRLDDYVKVFPELGPLETMPAALVAEEYRVRRIWGDRPSQDEFLRRFPGLSQTLPKALACIETSLAAGSDGKSPPGAHDPGVGSGDSTVSPVDPWATDYSGTPIPGGDLNATTDGSNAAGPSRMRYRILRKYARGGLGEVFVARDEEVPREVALKQIQDALADYPDSRARFVMEAEITGGLEHPGIVPVYGLGAYSDGRPYYAMRFIRGDSLKDAIERFHSGDGRLGGERPSPAPNGAPSPLQGKVQGEEAPPSGARAIALDPRRFGGLEFRQLLSRFIAVCNAIDYAHSRGVIHRDLKPANIMLGKFGETLVVDWGLAKTLVGPQENGAGEEATLRPRSTLGSSATRTGKAIGTPQFMSPEQAVGRLDEMGPASDIYSLGATLYALVAGRAPFQGDDVHHVIDRVARGDLERPRQVNRHVPPALEAVCLKAMAFRGQDRYGTPRLLAEDIERWLADEPVSVYREPLRTRLRRWIRRHPTLVSSVTVGLVLTVAAAFYVAWLQFRLAESQRREGQHLHTVREISNDAILASAASVKESPGMAGFLPELLKDLGRTNAAMMTDVTLEPKVRRDAAIAQLELCDAFTWVGEWNLARKNLEQVEHVIRELRNESDDASLGFCEARAQYLRAEWELDTEPDNVQQNADKAISILSSFDTTTQLSDLRCRCLLVKGLAVAETLEGQRYIRDAHHQYENLVKSLTRTDADSNLSTRIHEGWARSKIAHGHVLSKNGNRIAANKLYLQVAHRLKSLVEGLQSPTNYLLQVDLVKQRCTASIEYANGLKQLGKDAERLKEYRSVEQDCKQLLSDHPNSSLFRQYQIVLLMNRAQVYRKLGWNNAAEMLLNKAGNELNAMARSLDDYDHALLDARINVLLGQVLDDAGEDRLAIHAFELATGLLEELINDPRSVTEVQGPRQWLTTAKMSEGRLFHRLGSYPEARGLYLRALEQMEMKKMRPSGQQHDVVDQAAFVNQWLSESYRAENRPDKARSYFEKAVALRRQLSDPEDLYNLALLMLDADPQGNAHEAEGLLLKAHEQAPENARYRSALAAAYYRLGELEKCFNELDGAKECRAKLPGLPNNPDVSAESGMDLLYRAMACKQQQRHNEARKAYDKAISQARADGIEENLRFIRLRDEASTLLGLPDATSSQPSPQAR